MALDFLPFLVLAACFFNFIDRVADAFGVDLDALLKTAAPMTPEGEALNVKAGT